MSPADAQEKKDEKFPDRVTVRHWIKGQKEFQDPIKDVKAKFREVGKKDKETVWMIDPYTATKPPAAMSEITDKDGVVWVVTRVEIDASEAHTCYVKKKDPPKKEE